MSGTSAIGSVVSLVRKTVTGTAGTGNIGSVVLSIDDAVIPTGVAGVGAVGTVRIIGWTVVPDTQTPNWTGVNDSQTPNWVEVNIAA